MRQLALNSNRGKPVFFVVVTPPRVRAPWRQFALEFELACLGHIKNEALNGMFPDEAIDTLMRISLARAKTRHVFPDNHVLRDIIRNPSVSLEIREKAIGVLCDLVKRTRNYAMFHGILPVFDPRICSMLEAHMDQFDKYDYHNLAYLAKYSTTCGERALGLLESRIGGIVLKDVLEVMLEKTRNPDIKSVASEKLEQLAQSYSRSLHAYL